MRIAVDLFAGAGGATQGLRDAGFDVVAAVENDVSAAATWSLNHPGRMFVEDVRDVTPADLKSAWDRRRRLDLLKACPPCQGFSSLRGAQYPDQARNDLVTDTLRLVDGLHPRAVLVENVPGLRHDKRFATLSSELRGRGYELHNYLLDAADFGVPQRRRRLVVIAIEDFGRELLPRTLDELVPSDQRPPAVTAGSALTQLKALLPDPDPWNIHRTMRDKTRRRVSAVPPGGSRFDLPDELQLDCHRNLSRPRDAAASYGRVRVDDFAPTMTTRCTTPACGSFIHPSEHRGLTLREAAAFQTFPPDYDWTGHYGEVERQIGNAVPARLAQVLGQVVLGLLDRNEPRRRGRRQSIKAAPA